MIKYMAIGMAVLVALLGVSGFLLKQSYAANGQLEVANANQKAVIDQRERDARDNAVAVAQLSQKLNDTETKVLTTERVIYAAPKTVVCGDQPSIRAAIDGVSNLYAPAVPAPGGRQPAAALPATAAPAKLPK